MIRGSLMFAMLLIILCSCDNRGPVAMVSVKVIREDNKVINNCNVSVGFLSNLDANKEASIKGNVNNEGIFSAKYRTNGIVGATISKAGYYNSNVGYRFNKKSNNRWEPWNPELAVILRKIENPVPMYARKAELILPVLNKNVDFDLIEYDWVAPYGKGKHGDISFNSNKRWVSNLDFDGTLTIKFNGSKNGILLINESRTYGSQFKLPRYAPENGYIKQIQKSIHAKPGEGINYDYHGDRNYIFRIRSENGAYGKLNSMYGKIHGDISYGFKDKSAVIIFNYYVNPDHTRNLEFNPKRNLFTNLPEVEGVRLP